MPNSVKTLCLVALMHGTSGDGIQLRNGMLSNFKENNRIAASLDTLIGKLEYNLGNVIGEMKTQSNLLKNAKICNDNHPRQFTQCQPPKSNLGGARPILKDARLGETIKGMQDYINQLDERSRARWEGRGNTPRLTPGYDEFRGNTPRLTLGYGERRDNKNQGGNNGWNSGNWSNNNWHNKSGNDWNGCIGYMPLDKMSISSAQA